MLASQETIDLLPKVATDFTTAPTVVTLTASTRARLTATATAGKVGITLAADPANTSDVYIGDASVTNTVSWMAVINPTNSPVLIPIKDASKLYAYSTGTSQKYAWSVL
jgi:hypothetical protein